MKIKIFLIIILIAALSQPLIFSGDKKVEPKSPTIVAESKATVTTSEQITSSQLDPRAKILADYLNSYNSPLALHAQDFIDAADFYGVDWKLVPSISGVESTFGKQSYGYNAWGWGIYGNQAIGFNSWKDGIYTVTAGLKQNYIDKGLTDPYSINRVYAASPTWGAHVSYFLADLTNYANKYSDVQPKTTIELYQIAGPSAQMSNK